jgi:metal-responsive CopG/Arc/MetJ family transcriptional regulator
VENRRIPRFQRETVSFGVSIPKTLQIVLDAEVAAADSNRSAVVATALNFYINNRDSTFYIN